jgi:hypothetical protein
VRVPIFQATALLCGCALLGLVGGCARKPATGVFVDPAFGPLIAPDTKLLAGIRLDKIRETPLYKKLGDRLDLDRRLDLFSRRTGLDPRKDLWQALLVSNGQDILVMARARFSVAGDMEPHLGALGRERTAYKDYTLIGSPQTSVVFINAGVAVAGAQSALKNLIDHRAEYKNIPKTLLEKLATLPREDQMWLVDDGALAGLSTRGPDTTGVRSMLSNLVASIRTTTMGVHIGEGVQMEGAVDCVSEQGAKRVHDAMKGAIGLARLNTRESQMEMLKLYDAVQVNQNGSQVAISARVAPDLVEPLLKMLTVKTAPGT